MPELPEIETVKLQLSPVLVGQKSTKCEVLSIKVIRGSIDRIVGKKVTGIRRLGKVLLVDFGPDLTLGFHFKMTGQLIYIPHPSPSPKFSPWVCGFAVGEGNERGEVLKRIVGGHPTEDFIGSMPSSHTRVIFHLSGGTLYFNDQRLFGWVEINPKFVDKLGPEPFAISSDEFSKRISKTKRPIKLAIMDQEIISGVGNIYANDALWEARIEPRTPSSQLSVEQLAILLEKIKLVLQEGIKYGGATAADAKYIDLHGLGGHYQEHFRVYDREGQKCKRCGSIIEKFALGSRGTYVCKKCQLAQF